jgi:hypothetical protein
MGGPCHTIHKVLHKGADVSRVSRRDQDEAVCPFHLRDETPQVILQRAVLLPLGLADIAATTPFQMHVGEKHKIDGHVAVLTQQLLDLLDELIAVTPAWATDDRKNLQRPSG